MWVHNILVKLLGNANRDPLRVRDQRASAGRTANGVLFPAPTLL